MNSVPQQTDVMRVFLGCLRQKPFYLPFFIYNTKTLLPAEREGCLLQGGESLKVEQISAEQSEIYNYIAYTRI